MKKIFAVFGFIAILSGCAVQPQQAYTRIHPDQETTQAQQQYVSAQPIQQPQYVQVQQPAQQPVVVINNNMPAPPTPVIINNVIGGYQPQRYEPPPGPSAQELFDKMDAAMNKLNARIDAELAAKHDSDSSEDSSDDPPPSTNVYVQPHIVQPQVYVQPPQYAPPPPVYVPTPVQPPLPQGYVQPGSYGAPRGYTQDYTRTYAPRRVSYYQPTIIRQGGVW